MRAFFSSASSSTASVLTACGFARRSSEGNTGCSSGSRSSVGWRSWSARFPDASGFALGAIKRMSPPRLRSAAREAWRATIEPRLAPIRQRGHDAREAAAPMRPRSSWPRQRGRGARPANGGTSRSANPAAAIVRRPEKAPTRDMLRPAPSPMSRQSRQDSPMISNSSRPTIAAAATETGNAAALRPARDTSRCRPHPTAPPDLACGESVPRSRTDSASAASSSTTGTNVSSEPDRFQRAIEQQAKAPAEQNDRDQEGGEAEALPQQIGENRPVYGRESCAVPR